ncbi:SDR family oxidoreductase [Glutamicibacter endophyticus]|uniref:SDR family oxidoreductase n=1 Tax=Glutamicibacter endophyticus TaxID=1522174 RepID=UPI003AEF933F
MEPRDKRALVVGATGYVGRFLVARLRAQGFIIRVVVRDQDRAMATGSFGAPPLEGLVDEWVVARDASELGTPVVDGVHHVFSALGVTRQKADPWDIDFRLNLRYLELAEEARVDSFLYVGVMNAAEGTSALMRAKYAFMQALKRSKVAGQIVNPSGYFSDLTEIFELTRRGLAVGLGDASVRLSPIHGADLAEFCVQRLSYGAGSWDVGGPEALSYREIVELAAEAAGKTPRYVAVPHALASCATWVADRMGPRSGSLTRFFIEGMQRDSVGELHGSRTLRSYYVSLANVQNSEADSTTGTPRAP